MEHFTTLRKKKKCGSESDSDSDASVYFGRGYQGRWSKHFGYKIGLIMSPFVKFKQAMTICESESESESDGDFDLDIGIIFIF